MLLNTEIPTRSSKPHYHEEDSQLGIRLYILQTNNPT